MSVNGGLKLNAQLPLGKIFAETTDCVILISEFSTGIIYIGVVKFYVIFISIHYTINIHQNTISFFFKYH